MRSVGQGVLRHPPAAGGELQPHRCGGSLHGGVYVARAPTGKISVVFVQIERKLPEQQTAVRLEGRLAVYRAAIGDVPAPVPCQKADGVSLALVEQAGIGGLTGGEGAAQHPGVIVRGEHTVKKLHQVAVTGVQRALGGGAAIGLLVECSCAIK